MNVKKFMLATLFGFAVMFILGWIGHNILMMELYSTSPMAAIERETPYMLGIAGAYLSIALLMAYFYPKTIEGRSTWGSGARFGVFAGLLLAIPVSLILYSTINLEFSRVFAEGVWHAIEQGAGGIAIAYGYKVKATSAATEPA